MANPSLTPSPTAPTFTFTRRVGDANTRAEVAEFLAACFDASGIDFSGTTYTVRLTRENAAAQGHFRALLVNDGNNGRETARRGGEIAINLTSEWGWRINAAHETIHALQYAVGALHGRISPIMGTMQTFNQGAAFLLSQVLRDGVEVDEDAWTEADRHGETVAIRRGGNFHHYVATHHERQAFRVTPALLRRVNAPRSDVLAAGCLARATIASVRHRHGALSEQGATAAFRLFTREAREVQRSADRAA